MDCQDYITGPAERKKGQHLQREERGAIQHLKCQGYTNRAIAREIGCSPSTVANELRRGTPPRKSNKGRKPGYSARHGEAVYKANRKHSRKHHRICRCAHFLRWVVKQFKEHKWSLDACVGYARLHGLFPADEMVCTRTLYNEVWAGNLDLSVTELPEAMKRKQHKDSKPREHKKNFGTDISQRPEIAALRIEEGHWEGDTVVGKGHQGVLVTLEERKSRYTLAQQLDSRHSAGVTEAVIALLRPHKHLCETITFDNGKEFAEHAFIAASLGADVYFAHPYHSWERGLNENTNGLLRQYFPKCTNLRRVSQHEVDDALYRLNHRPRKCLNYRTPHEVFMGLEIRPLH